MTDKKTRWAASAMVPWILGLAVLLLYTFTRSREVTAGLSAQTLNAVCDLYYLPLTTHLLYQVTARMLCAVLPGPVFSNMVFISVFFGALCVVLFYQLMLHARPYESEMDTPPPVRKRSLQYGALLAAILLVPALPLWLLATTPAHATFDAALLLLCFLLLARYPHARGCGGLLLAAFLYGLGITENVIMIGLAPVFILMALYSLYRKGGLSKRLLFLLAGLGLAGLLFYGAPIWAVASRPDYGYGEFANASTVLLDLWRKQYRELKASLPTVGGLLILLTTLAPWLYTLFIPKPARKARTIAHVATLGALIFLNLLGLSLLFESRFSPVHYMGMSPSILLSYMLIASWTGYLGGYWLLRAQLAEGPAWGRLLWFTPALLPLLASAGLLVNNHRLLAQSQQAELTLYSRDIIRSCQDKPLFFATGTAQDDILRFLAFEGGASLEVINPVDLSRLSYRRALASKLNLPDVAATNSLPVLDRIKGLLEQLPAGLNAAAFFHPDMVMSLGFQPLPNGLVSFAVTNLNEVDPLAFHRQNKALMEGPFAATLQSLPPTDQNGANTALSREYSRAANNVGVTLRMFKQEKLAQESFETALAISPDNPSALINLRGLYMDQAAQLQQTNKDKAEELQIKAKALLDQAFQEAQKLGPASRNPAFLTSQFGMIYSVGVTLLLAQGAQSAGFTDYAASTMAQARMISPDHRAVKASSALFNFGKGNLDEAEAEYQDILQQRPNELTALLGYAAVAYSRGQITEAITRLNQNAALLNETPVQSFLALLHAENKDPEQALVCYTKASASTNITAISSAFLAITAQRLSRWTEAEKHAQAALAVAPNNAMALRILADMSRRKGDLRQLEERLERLVKASLEDLEAQEQLLALYMETRQESKARNLAQFMLEAYPEHVIANQTMAVLSTLPEVQEQYLRKAVVNTQHPLHSYALNNLAYVLILQTNYAEALPLANSAVRQAPDQASFYHTLASAHLGLQQYAQAEESIMTACTLAPQQGSYALLHGEIALAMGQTAKARDLISQALPHLQDQDRNKALALLSRITGE